ncbi:hypothetical protein [Pontibacterium sp.]|uniref:hypothetical protein n=1 Tax=Pontibacterium sp. TaxID=2036026 RepID=UPI003559731A
MGTEQQAEHNKAEDTAQLFSEFYGGVDEGAEPAAARYYALPERTASGPDD